MKIAAQLGWFDRFDYIETLDIWSELIMNGYERFHETGCAYVFPVVLVDNLILE